MALVFLLLFHLLSLDSADSKCPESFQCGKLDSLEFPFTDRKDPGCGLFLIDGCDSENQRINFGGGGSVGYWYDIVDNRPPNKFLLRDRVLQSHLSSKSCFSFRNLSLPQFPFSSVAVSPNLTVFTCTNGIPGIAEYFIKYNYSQAFCDQSLFAVYYKVQPAAADEISGPPQQCTVIQLPIKSDRVNSMGTDLYDMLTAEFTLEWDVSQDRYDCHHGRGQCLINNMKELECKKGNNNKQKLIIAIVLGGSAFLLLLCLLVCFIIWQRKKRSGGYFRSRNISSNPSSKSDVEGGSFYYAIPIFSYKELEVATNNFDPSKELGDGGFGTVYYGKLRDGREVAIKRLYEHNYRRVEQFMNEIKILTCLRHPNLVSLYGCTSRRSQELLLVYEYIPNGTVADHLHGERAHESLLTWPVRMSIAIETATALAYLHKSDIIHRDVKTNNILLDDNFFVKVADFGLSRLFPTDVTHISTAPQGTPGYVDPEYHQCYQLTDRSDVYSFGVVLIELISSMPAVDISRHRHEINLANLAVNRIQRCAFDELIDSSLGYDSDAEVARMTTSVAELAFRCLQLDKDMRPSMDEVVVFLKDIQGGGDCNLEKVKGADGNYVAVPGKMVPPSPETEDVVLLKNKNFQPSPNAVTDVWVSGSSTTASSIG